MTHEATRTGKLFLGFPRIWWLPSSGIMVSLRQHRLRNNIITPVVSDRLVAKFAFSLLCSVRPNCAPGCPFFLSSEPFPLAALFPSTFLLSFSFVSQNSSALMCPHKLVCFIWRFPFGFIGSQWAVGHGQLSPATKKKKKKSTAMKSRNCSLLLCLSPKRRRSTYRFS